MAFEGVEAGIRGLNQLTNTFGNIRDQRIEDQKKKELLEGVEGLAKVIETDPESVGIPARLAPGAAQIVRQVGPSQFGLIAQTMLNQTFKSRVPKNFQSGFMKALTDLSEAQLTGDPKMQERALKQFKVLSDGLREFKKVEKEGGLLAELGFGVLKGAGKGGDGSGGGSLPGKGKVTQDVIMGPNGRPMIVEGRKDVMDSVNERLKQAAPNSFTAEKEARNVLFNMGSEEGGTSTGIRDASIETISKSFQTKTRDAQRQKIFESYLETGLIRPVGELKQPKGDTSGSNNRSLPSIKDLQNERARRIKDKSGL